MEFRGTGRRLALETHLELYGQMLRIRRFEERVQRLFQAGLVAGSCHLAIGHEAVAAGAIGALESDDPVFATYRGHHVVVARGVPLAALLAELTGWGGAINKGKGGSMHLTSVEHACFGSYAIVGGHLPIACGSAYASQVLGDSAVTAVFFGEGATNIGAFHEAVNLAAVWRLPLVFVCENNLYAEYSAARDQSLLEHPAVARAEGNGVAAAVVDGNDVEAVYVSVAAAAEHARAGHGPALVECKTYRHFGHSRDDPAKYRPDDEVAAWLERDPIPLARERLLDDGVARSELDALDRASVQEVDAAEVAARGAPEIDPAVISTDVWAAEETRWRN